MIQKLIEFFQNLFGGVKNNGTDNHPDPTPIPPPHIPNPEPAPTETEIIEDGDVLVSDGSDLLADPDTIGTTVFPEELEIAEVGELEPLEPIDITITEVPEITPIPEEPEEPVVDTPVEPEKPRHKKRYTWCLDNGHGRFTAGKRSPKFEDGNRFFEYEFNRDIVKRVIVKLDEVGVDYFNVVPEVDTDNFLKGRVDRANAYQSDLPKLFVSIHSNAAPAESSEHWAVPGAKGAETWYYTGSSRGRKLASIFQKHIVNYTGMVNRGLKSTKKLYVIKNTSMSACLTENGFYNHKAETLELMKDEVRQSIADAHIAAILEIEKNGLS